MVTLTIGLRFSTDVVSHVLYCKINAIIDVDCMRTHSSLTDRFTFSNINTKVFIKLKSLETQEKNLLTLIPIRTVENMILVIDDGSCEWLF